MNIIPSIDLLDGRCVRLYQGKFDRQTDYGQDPVSLARDYNTMGFDNLHIVDLDGARTGRQRNRKIIRTIVDTCNLSVQLGGGIRAESQLESWLDAGVARVVIGTLAISQSALVREWMAGYGAERFVLALDVAVDSAGTPRVVTHGWLQSAELTLWDCMDKFSAAGLRHVLCTDIGRDGAMTGPNLPLYAELVLRYPDVRLQASGGVRNIGDLETLRTIGVQAAISGRALLDGNITSREIARFLRAA